MPRRRREAAPAVQAAVPAHPPAGEPPLAIGPDGKVAVMRRQDRFRVRLTPAEWAEINAGYPGEYVLIPDRKGPR